MYIFCGLCQRGFVPSCTVYFVIKQTSFLSVRVVSVHMWSLFLFTHAFFMCFPRGIVTLGNWSYDSHLQLPLRPQFNDFKATYSVLFALFCPTKLLSQVTEVQKRTELLLLQWKTRAKVCNVAKGNSLNKSRLDLRQTQENGNRKEEQLLTGSPSQTPTWKTFYIKM